MKNPDPDKENPLSPYKKTITDKISQNGFKVGIRILVKSDNSGLFFNIVNGFSIFNNPAGNSFYLRRPHLWQKKDSKKHLSTAAGLLSR